MFAPLRPPARPHAPRWRAPRATLAGGGDDKGHKFEPFGIAAHQGQPARRELVIRADAKR